MPRKPNKLQGTSPYVQEFNALLDWIQSATAFRISGEELHKTVYGTTRRAIGKSSHGGYSAGMMRRFKIVTVYGSYVAANPWDNSSGAWDTGTTVNIAKPQHFRTDFASEVFLSNDGEEETVSYSYTTSNQRTATLGEDSELQVPIPRYLADSEIRAIQALTGVTVDEVELEWLEVAPSRVWAKQKVA